MLLLNRLRPVDSPCLGLGVEAAVAVLRDTGKGILSVVLTATLRNQLLGKLMQHNANLLSQALE
jgi:hypothetical protein